MLLLDPETGHLKPRCRQAVSNLVVTTIPVLVDDQLVGQLGSLTWNEMISTVPYRHLLTLLGFVFVFEVTGAKTSHGHPV